MVWDTFSSTKDMTQIMVPQHICFLDYIFLSNVLNISHQKLVYHFKIVLVCMWFLYVCMCPWSVYCVHAHTHTHIHALVYIRWHTAVVSSPPYLYHSIFVCILVLVKRQCRFCIIEQGEQSMGFATIHNEFVRKCLHFTIRWRWKISRKKEWDEMRAKYIQN
jgi:hypothetical protein